MCSSPTPPAFAAKGSHPAKQDPQNSRWGSLGVEPPVHDRLVLCSQSHNCKQSYNSRSYLLTSIVLNIQLWISFSCDLHHDWYQLIKITTLTNWYHELVYFLYSLHLNHLYLINHCLVVLIITILSHMIWSNVSSKASPSKTDLICTIHYK